MGLSLASRIRSGSRNAVLPLALILPVFLLGVAGEPAFLTLRYERAAVAGGEFWRLFTAHFVHLGWPHLLLNLAGLVLVWALVGSVFATRAWLFIGALSIAVMSAGFWFMLPTLSWYVGLSGLLHGLFAAGIVGSLVCVPGRRKEAVILAMLLAGKLAWEATQGAMPGSTEAAGGDVVTESHLFGAIGGAAAGLVCAWIMHRQARIRFRMDA